MFDIPLTDQSACAEFQVNPLIVRLALAAFRARGGDLAALCLDLDLDFVLADLEHPDFRLSYGQASKAIRHILDALQDPLLGLRIGMQHHVVSCGLVGFGAMAASTLQAAGALGIRFQNEAGSMLVLEAELDTDHVAVLASPRFSDVATEAVLVDGTYAALVCAARRIVGAHFRPRAVELVARQPLDISLHQQVFQCPVHFGCAHNRLLIDNEWVHKQVASGDPMSLRRITALLEAAVSRQPERTVLEAGIVTRLRNHLGNPPTLVELAQAFDMSERSLRRKLTEAGRSYGDMLDQLRTTRALEMLAHARYTTREIAEEVGFNDPRSLRRAFKRWTGRTLSSAKAGVVAHRLPKPG